MLNRIIFCCFLGLSLAACTQANEKLSEELKEKVLGLHDELMPQTEQIIQLQTKLDSLTDGKDSVHILQIKKALAKSDQAMMDWMHQFSIDSLEKMDIQSKIDYLGSQYVQLKSLQKLTDSSVNAAKTYHP